jgi:inner membrane transporter RhtA
VSATTESSPPFRQILLAVFAVLLGLASVNAGAAMAKTLFSAAGPAAMAMLRNGFASLMLLALWRPWRGARFVRRQILLLLAYGVDLGLMNLLYYYSLQRLPLGLAVTIEFIGPFTVALVNSRRPSDLLWLALALAGLALLMPWGWDGAALDLIGVAFALGAGIAWGLYIILSQKVGAVMPSGSATSWGTLIAAITIFPAAWHDSGSAFISTGILLPALAVALFSSAIPYSLDMIALKTLPARNFGILMSLDPAMAALIGFIMLGEDLTSRQQIAIACVMLASFGSTSAHRKAVLLPQESPPYPQ